MTKKQEVGNIGENVAEKYFKNQGYLILSRNYRKPWGEIDIVAKKDNIIHFIEVKSVSYETHIVGNRISDKNDEYRPEDNVHFWKIRRLHRVIQTYLGYTKVPNDQEWQIDVIAVFLDFKKKIARIRLTEDI